jgi:hypothetical protein
VIGHFYVDNWLTSFSSSEESEKVTNVLRRGGFELAQWGSSSPQVLLSLPGQPVSSIDLALQEMPIERTLGLSLDYNSDSFVVSAIVNTDSSKNERYYEKSLVSTTRLDLFRQSCYPQSSSFKPCAKNQ